jgi:peptidoglycan/xylan/chitin deacetylase (PgdA/CDA1 family)
MVALKFVVNAATSQVANVTFDSLYYGIYARPKILVVFDDNWDTQYSAAYAYMATKGLKGTIYVIKDTVGEDGHCTLAQLQEMYEAGWDLGTHGVNPLTNYATAVLQQAEIVYNQQYLVDNGWLRAKDHFAYPNGSYDDNSITALNTLGYKSARTIIGRMQDTGKGLDNCLLLTTRVMGGSSLTQATVQGYIDRATLNGGTFILYAHKIVAGAAANTNEWEDSKFNGVIDYLKARQDEGLLDVVTISEWYDGLK